MHNIKTLGDLRAFMEAQSMLSDTVPINFHRNFVSDAYLINMTKIGPSRFGPACAFAHSSKGHIEIDVEMQEKD